MASATAAVKASKQQRAAPARLLNESFLIWFCGPGQSAFQRSNFGSTIDRILAGARVSENCAQCQGTGVDISSLGFKLEHDSEINCRPLGEERVRLDDGGAEREAPACGRRCGWCSKCLGQRAQVGEPSTLAAKSRRGWCSKCRGQGVIERELKPSKSSREGYRRCKDCKGAGRGCPKCTERGYLVVDPVFETAVDEGSGYVPSHDALDRYAKVSRWLGLVAEHSNAAVEVIRTYCGEVGARWARTRHGRIMALYPLTPAGKKLVSMGLEGGKQEVQLSAAERIGVHAELERLQPQERRRLLLDAAHEQAEAYLAAAAGIWDQTLASGALDSLARWVSS